MTSHSIIAPRAVSPAGTPPAPPILLRAREVAHALGLHRSTVREMIAAGQLPTVHIGRAVRVPRASLEQWCRDRTEGVQTDTAVITPAPLRAAGGRR